MSNYNGYLIKTANGVIIDKYIEIDSYSTTPDQRQDQDSYRDGNGELHRFVLPSVVTTIKFTTLDNLTLDEKITLQNALLSGVSEAQERKTYLTYWNDEVNQYRTDYFYIPDTVFPVKYRTPDTIIYSAVSYQLIGYGTNR